jgi:hypothetical protein
MSATLVFWVCCSTATEALMTLTLCFLAQLRGKAGVLRHGEENPTRETDPPLHHLIGQEWRGVRAWFIHREEEIASIERESERERGRKKKKKKMGVISL